MLSLEERQQLSTKLEREKCQGDFGGVCHGIDDSDADLIGSLGLYTAEERDKIRQTIDWVSSHCQVVQCSSKDRRAKLPCLTVRNVIFEFNK